MGVCVPALQCLPSTITPTEPKLATRKRELASSHVIEHARLETLAEPRSCMVLPSGPGEHGARPTRTSCPAP